MMKIRAGLLVDTTGAGQFQDGRMSYGGPAAWLKTSTVLSQSRTPDSLAYFAHELACDLHVHAVSGYSAALNPLLVFL
jgi:hypothetical protein